MVEIVSINLDNELDLPLTHKRAVAITKYIGLTLSTQTTFAAAVSEVCRPVLEKTLNSVLSFRLNKEDARWFLSARIVTDVYFTESSEELKYAKRLIPVLEAVKNGDNTVITLKLGLPKAARVSGDMASRLAGHIKGLAAESPYEEIKLRNQQLFNLTTQQDEQLRIATLLNERKSEFLSIASHELRSPLTLIKAYAQIGKGFKDKDPAKMVTYLEKIDQQATKVNTLIQQLLDVSKIENSKLEFQLERIELNEFLHETLDAAILSNPTHTISLVTDAPVYVNIDKLRIEQVLINLVSNAVKYSEKGTPVVIYVKHDPSALTISVKDQGIGMSEENLAKVFNKFFRADEVSQTISGLGMGLYITNHIVKGHLGDIWAESKENEGSTFSFSLPIAG